MRTTSALRYLLLFILVSSVGLPVNAEFRSTDSLHLTRQKVKNWINTRIETAKLQNKMKTHASEYDDVVQAFFAQRKVLLKSRDWSVKEFEAVEKRINAATSAMDMSDDLKEYEADHRKQIAEIKSNKYYSEKQKEQMIGVLNKIRELKRTQFIEPTKPDWPAVKPFRKTLEKLTDWMAGNIPNPPKITS